MTGAGGFVGSGLVGELLKLGQLQAGGPRITSLTAIDLRLPEHVDRRLRLMSGDIADPAFQAEVFEQPFDVFFHLAAIPGGAAAADYRLGWRINVETTVALFEALAAQPKPPRVVFSSSIGVFGVPLPKDKVDDETLPLPTMSYGTQKLIAEALLADLSRRGLVDGLAVRLPGIVARPRIAGGHLSAYLSNIFHALAAGETFTCPVSPEATSWFMSRSRCIDNLIHAAALPSEHLTARAFNLPALHLSMTALIDGLASQFGSNVRNLVSYAPDPVLQAQFGTYPLLMTPIADRLGFRHDGEPAMLVANSLELDVGIKG